MEQPALAERKFLAKRLDEIHLAGKPVAVDDHLAHQVHEVIEPFDIDADELFLDVGRVRGPPADAALFLGPALFGLFDLLLERCCSAASGRRLGGRLAQLMVPAADGQRRCRPAKVPERRLLQAAPASSDAVRSSVRLGVTPLLPRRTPSPKRGRSSSFEGRGAGLPRLLAAGGADTACGSARRSGGRPSLQVCPCRFCGAGRGFLQTYQQRP